jgi:hypothetical protein
MPLRSGAAVTTGAAPKNRKVPLETGHLDSKHGKCGSNWQQESTKIEPESRDNRARMAAK